MIKILFICHGNICRSPMAEYVMRELIRREGLADRYEIASAATSSEELGNPVYPPVSRLLREHGIDCSKKTARRLCREDYALYDLLIGMDRQNLRNMERICGGDPEGKFRLLMACAGEQRDLADPWYTRDFRACWKDIGRGCRGLLNRLEGRED